MNMETKRTFWSCFNGGLLVLLFTILPLILWVMSQQGVGRDVLTQFTLLFIVITPFVVFLFAVMMVLIFIGEEFLIEHDMDADLLVPYEIGQKMIWYGNPVGWIASFFIWVLKKYPGLCLAITIFLPN